MRQLTIALALLLLAAPAAAQITEDGFAIRDGQVFGKWIKEGRVILDLFGTSGDGILEVLCPLAEPGVMLAKCCKMIEIGEIASLWDGLPPNQYSEFSGLHRLTSVTIGQHGNAFAVYRGEVVGKRIEGGHVILDLWGWPEDGILEVLCPMHQPGDLLAETCNMIEIGDVAYLWDGLAPDPTSDFPNLYRLTSVTIGRPMYSEILTYGFDSRDLHARP